MFGMNSMIIGGIITARVISTSENGCQSNEPDRRIYHTEILFNGIETIYYNFRKDFYPLSISFF